MSHKWRCAVVIALIAVVGYFSYGKFFPASTAVKYVSSPVERGVLITSISGTGQVAASDQIDLTAKAGGDISFLKAVVGQEVKAGTLIAQIDARDALKTVRDARTSLETAQLSLEKLQHPADALTILQAENSLLQTQESYTQAQDSLTKSYDDGFNTVANAFLDLPTVMNGLKELLYGNAFASGQSNIDWYANQGIAYSFKDYDKIMNYRSQINSSYSSALVSYNTNLDHYKSATRSSSTSTVESLILETYDTAKVIADVVKNSKNYVDFVYNAMLNNQNNSGIPATITAHQSTLDGYTSKTNSQLLSLLGIKNTIANAKTTIESATRSIAEKTQSLADLKAGADEFDLRSAQLSVTQKQNSLRDAEEKLADYSARAPFDGIIAVSDLKKGDTVSSGATVVTLITKQKTATITLNEVDAAKVKVGQKVMLSFDAIDGLSITGAVGQVDTLGTVSQGVVSYNVKIVFDIQDDRVKSGMTASASIIIESKPDVLMVKSAAVKTQGGANFVQVLVNGAPQNKDVVVGSSNDTMTEIVSGLTEGEEVVTQTISGVSASKTTTTGSSSGRAGSGMMMIGSGPRD